MTPAAAPTRFEAVLARFMFLLSFAFLLLVAGLIHRAQQPQVTQGELNVMYAGLIALWPIFVVEAIAGVARRDRTKPLRPVFLRALLVCLMPPWRMGLVNPRTGLVWVPRIGWAEPGKELFKRIDKA